MDRLRESSDKLEFRYYPVRTWVVAIVALLMTLFLLQRLENTSLTCTRSDSVQSVCQVRRNTGLQIHGNLIREFPLSALQKAEIKNQGRCYRVYLQLKGEPAFSVSGCRRRGNVWTIEKEVSRINAFITAEVQPFLYVEDRPDLKLNQLSLLFLAVILARMLYSDGQILVSTFDKTNGGFKLQRFSLWKRPPIIYSLYEISRVEVEEKKPRLLREGGYRLNLILRSEQKVPFTALREHKEKNRQRLQSLCDRINQFLNS
jgi:hypothetical protein